MIHFTAELTVPDGAQTRGLAERCMGVPLVERATGVQRGIINEARLVGKYLLEVDVAVDDDAIDATLAAQIPAGLEYITVSVAVG